MSEKKMVRVKDIMKTKFDMVEGTATIEEALEQMAHVDTKTLIVNKRHDDDEYGIVLLSDIAKQVLAKDRAPSRVNIYEVMTKPVIKVSPDMDIRYCARLFSRHHLARAPVVDHGTIIGIISFTDMVLKGLRNQ